MHSPRTWRELLGTIIADAPERQRIVKGMGINSVTLTRWANSMSTPRLSNLCRLLDLLPEHSPTLLALIEAEFPGFSLEKVQDALRQPEAIIIPSEFYRRVLHTAVRTSKQLLFSSLCNLILQQALEQLDPHRLGMAIIVVRLMPPSADGKIRSLREVAGKGTPPWPRDLEHQGILLGAESLAGASVTSGHIQVNQRLRESQNMAPGYQGLWEESAAATPIMRAGEIAGCLLVSSTQPDYFVPALCSLIENYAELIPAAFAPEDFHPSECIVLGVVPFYEAQHPFLSQFQPRVAEVMREAAKAGHPLLMLEAEQIIWRQIEEELLGLPYNRE